jgi:hypothetical protein
MKIYYLSGDKTEIEQLLNDKSIKKYIEKQITFGNNCIIKFIETVPDNTLSYFGVKYGDYIKNFNNIIPDRTPVMWVDYSPIGYKDTNSDK